MTEKLQVVLQSPLNYTGSKSKVIEKLRPLFPSGANRCFDIFCGGGGFFINTLSDFEQTIANDKLSPLIYFYKWLQITSWEEVLCTICYYNISKTSQEEYLKLRDRYNRTRSPIDFFILCCCCTNNMSRFNSSGGFNQTWGKRNFNTSTGERLKLFHEKLYRNEAITFSCCDFGSLSIGSGDFVYLDPPYFKTGAGYNLRWTTVEENRLCDYLDKLDGEGIKFLLSNVSEYNGIVNPNLRRFQRYDVIDLEGVDYQKASKSKIHTSREIVVKNY